MNNPKQAAPGNGITRPVYAMARETCYRRALQDIRQAAENGATAVTLVSMANTALDRGQALLETEFPAAFDRQVAA
jgi:hypothetical protein